MSKPVNKLTLDRVYTLQGFQSRKRLGLNEEETEDELLNIYEE